MIFISKGDSEGLGLSADHFASFFFLFFFSQLVVSQDAIPRFVALLNSPNEQLREQAAWALGNIAGDSPSFRDRVLQAG
tara:strand:+ start:660 stop:896 length:237 start_codon:yes stop_codon:yes gene_type:complete